MTQDHLKNNMIELVGRYIANADSFDSNPQLRIVPATMSMTIVNGRDMLAEIEVSDENVDDEAGVDGERSEEYADYQASRNPDFYPVRALITEDVDKRTIPDANAIEHIAASYIF